MTEHNIVAILQPLSGKMTELRKAMKAMIDGVFNMEPYTVRYLVAEEIDAETPRIVVTETYSSKDSIAQHRQQPHCQMLLDTLKKEKILSRSTVVVKTVDVAGFDRDRKLITSKL